MVSEGLFDTPYPDPSKSVVRDRVASIATVASDTRKIANVS